LLDSPGSLGAKVEREVELTSLSTWMKLEETEERAQRDAPSYLDEPGRPRS